LYAIWTPITYNIIYNGNGGIGAMNKQICKYDQETSLLPNTFTKDLYNFLYWTTNSDGSGIRYNDG
jgi:hypothetical protein